ncbi:MAG: carboxymuconolactone decarboxylase family protein, partial [bacterium]
MARIKLPTRESLPDDESRDRWDRQAGRTGRVLNIQRAFLTNPGIDLNAFRVWRASGLEPRARELVILRSAFQKRSTYEWHQHVRIARDAGLTDQEIIAIGDWRSATLFSPNERALLGYVDALAESPRPSDDAFAQVSEGRTDG